MDKVLLVGAGGFLGSILRYGTGELVNRWKAGWAFPLETLVINAAGCLVLGLLAGFGEARGMLSAHARAFLFIGLLGGFTTFSTFGYETFDLLRGGQWPAAILSVTLQVLLGTACVWLGMTLARIT